MTATNSSYVGGVEISPLRSPLRQSQISSVNDYVAGSATTTGISKAAHHLHVNGRATDVLAAGAGAVVYTGGQVLGGLAMIGPNTLLSVSEAPELVAAGARKIGAGVEHRNWEPIVEGTGKILEAAGNVASAAVLAESGLQAARTRSAVKSALAPPADNLTLEIEGPKPSTGKTPGTAYHRMMRDPAGHMLSKTTTVVS
jgi:hypothetical protein